MREVRKPWTAEEDKVLKTLAKISTRRWAEISEEMKERFLGSGGRTPEQCKERWINCLCPKFNRDDWSKDQLKYLFDLHMENGNKWNDITRKLKTGFGTVRADGATKNQFYSALRRGLRRICKVLGIKNGTQMINKVRPKTLSALLQGSSKISKEQIYKLIFDCSDNEQFEKLKPKISEAGFRQIIDDILIKVFGREEYELLLSDTNIYNSSCTAIEQINQQSKDFLPDKNLERSFQCQQEVEMVQIECTDKKMTLAERIEDEQSVINNIFNSRNINGSKFESNSGTAGNFKQIVADSWTYQKGLSPACVENLRNIQPVPISTAQFESLVTGLQKLDLDSSSSVQ